MRKTIEVHVEEKDGHWCAVMTVDSVAEVFVFASKDEARAGLRRALDKATELMWDGPVVGITAIKTPVAA